MRHFYEIQIALPKNKVLLEHKVILISLPINYGCLLTTAAELNSCTRDCMAQYLSDPLHEMFAHPCSQLLTNVMCEPLVKSRNWVISSMEVGLSHELPTNIARVLHRVSGRPGRPGNLISPPDKQRALC